MPCTTCQCRPVVTSGRAPEARAHESDGSAMPSWRGSMPPSMACAGDLTAGHRFHCRGGSSRWPADWATASSGTCCSRCCRCSTAPPPLRPAIVMALTGALGVALYTFLKRSSCASARSSRIRPSTRRAAPLDRYSFPSGHTLHAVSFTWQASAHFPELGWVLVPLARADRRLACRARPALSRRDVLAGAAHRRGAGRTGTRLGRPAHPEHRARLRVRVLFISDVYFPRVNGVSTSIRTFRQDLAQLPAWRRCWWRPRYRGCDQPPRRRAGVAACAVRAACRAIRRTGACAGARCTRRSTRCRAATSTWCISTRRSSRTTPACASRAAPTSRASRPITPSSRSTCTTTCRCCRARSAASLARGFTRSQCAAVAGARSRPPSRCARCSTEYGVTHADPRAAHRAGRRPLPPRRRRALPRARRHRRRAPAACLHRPRRAREEHRLPAAGVRARAPSVPQALLVIAGEGPARERCARRWPQLGLERRRALRRLPGARRGAARLLCGRGRVRVRLAHRDPGAGAAGGDGAGRAGGLHGRLGTRSILARAAARWSCRRRRALSPPRWCAAHRRAAARGLARAGARYARTWSSAAMAQRLAELYRELPRSARSVPRLAACTRPAASTVARSSCRAQAFCGYTSGELDAVWSGTWRQAGLDRRRLQVRAPVSGAGPGETTSSMSTAPRAPSGDRLPSHNRPDVIFMDHLMPGMDGLQAVQAIKNDPRTATIPIMMYTSQEGELYLGQARALGAVGVLPKQIKHTDVSKVLYELHLVAGPPQSPSSPASPPSSRMSAGFRAQRRAFPAAHRQHPARAFRGAAPGADRGASTPRPTASSPSAGAAARGAAAGGGAGAARAGHAVALDHRLRGPGARPRQHRAVVAQRARARGPERAGGPARGSRRPWQVRPPARR